MDRPATRQEIIAARIGLKPKARPMVRPARDEWDRVSPIIDNLLSRTNWPIHGKIKAKRLPTIKALCINSYSNISGILPHKLSSSLLILSIFPFLILRA